MNLKNNIKAILFDVDKTLVDRSLNIKPSLKKALYKLKEKGYKLGINSGRPIFSSFRVLEKNDILSLFDYFYGCNGLEFYDLENKRSVYLKELDSTTIKKLDKQFWEDYLELSFYKDNEYLYMNHEIDDKKQIEKWTKARFVLPKIIDFQTIDYSIPKCVVLFKHDYLTQVQEKFNDIYMDDIDIFLSGDECAEVVPKGIDKGVAVSDLACKLNINEKSILAIGDSENDIPALEKATGIYVDGDSKKIAYSCSFEQLGQFLIDNFQL